jgi:nitroreductase
MRLEEQTTDRRIPDTLATAMLTQRSLRRVHPDPVDDDIVLECVRMALQAPTAFNIQAWDFVIVRDTATKAALGELYREIWSTYHAVVGRGRRVEELKQLRATQWQVEHFHQIPVVVVACQSGRRRKLPVFESSFYGSIYPAVQNFMLAAVGLGLGAAPVTMPLADLNAVRRILGLPRHVHPCCLITVGWPIGRYGRKDRRPLGEVTHLDQYGHRPWLNGTGAPGAG